MSFMQRLTDVVFSIALALWLALAVMGGFTAMAVFPAAREMPLSLAGYEAYLATEQTQGRQLIAGHLVEQVFTAANAPRVACAVVAALAILVQLALAKQPPFARTRLAILALALGTLLLGTMFTLPSFQSADRKYRALASTPDTIPLAIEMKPLVDEAHERASRVATAEVGSVLALIALSAFAAGGPRRG